MNKPSICSQTRDRHLGRSCSGQYGPWFQAILKIKKCCVLCCYVVTLLHCYDGWKCRACHCWHVSPHVGISQHLCIIIIIPCKAMNIPLFLYIYLIIYIYIYGVKTRAVLTHTHIGSLHLVPTLWNDVFPSAQLGAIKATSKILEANEIWWSVPKAFWAPWNDKINKQSNNKRHARIWYYEYIYIYEYLIVILNDINF